MLCFWLIVNENDGLAETSNVQTREMFKISVLRTRGTSQLPSHCIVSRRAGHVVVVSLSKRHDTAPLPSLCCVVSIELYCDMRNIFIDCYGNPFQSRSAGFQRVVLSGLRYSAARFRIPSPLGTLGKKTSEGANVMRY